MKALIHFWTWTAFFLKGSGYLFNIVRPVYFSGEADENRATAKLGAALRPAFR